MMTLNRRRSIFCANERREMSINVCNCSNEFAARKGCRESLRRSDSRYNVEKTSRKIIQFIMLQNYVSSDVQEIIKMRYRMCRTIICVTKNSKKMWR